MPKENIVLEKSYRFSIRIIKLYVHLVKQQKIYALADQVVRSGTSIGANIEEATGASSRRDFKAKLDISYKEARETKYWLRLLRDCDLLDKKLSNSLIQDCDELVRLLSSITLTLKAQPNS